MPAYPLLDIDIHDKAKYETCKKEVPAFIAKHGCDQPHVCLRRPGLTR